MADINGDYHEQFRSNTNNATEALSELIDNSLDAGATDIRIEYHSGKTEKGFLSIADNGSGMDANALDKMFQLGGSLSKNDVQKSGRFGHGSKVGMAFFGNVWEVSTVFNKKLHAVVWDTDTDIESGVWKKGYELSGPIASREGNGTLLRVSRMRRKTIQQQTWDNIAWEFTPALQAGCRISCSGESLKPQVVPWKGTPQHRHGEIDGQKFKLTYGRLQEGTPRKFRGVHCIRLNRFVKDLSSWTDPVDHTALCVVVNLLMDGGKDDWMLDSLKRGFKDQEMQDDLESHIREICKDEIKKFNTENITQECQALSAELCERSSVFMEQQGGSTGVTTGGDGTLEGEGGGGEGEGGDSGSEGLTGQTGTGHVEKEKKKKCRSIDYKFIDLGVNEENATVHYNKDEKMVVVTFNTDTRAFALTKARTLSLCCHGSLCVG